jgi:putative transposase
MKKGRFSEEQMVGILREADRSPVAQVAKKHGISEQTIYTWRQRFAGMSADDVKRLRLLEQENTRLKKILAERDLEIEVMKEIAAKKWAARESLNLALIEPGKPWQNGLKESFNGKFRDECLSMEWFRCRTEARVVIEEWRRHYNSVRPHSSLNNMTPEHFCRQYGKNMNRGETLKN